MNKNFVYLNLFMLIVGLAALFLSGYLFFLYRADKLAKVYTFPTAGESGSVVSLEEFKAAQVPVLEKEAKANLKIFSAKIKKIEGAVFTVTAYLPDFSKSQIDEQSGLQPGVINKEYAVKVNGETVFPGQPLAEFKAGDSIAAEFNEPVLGKTELTATSIVKILDLP